MLPAPLTASLAAPLLAAVLGAGIPGDANCDGRLTPADLAALEEAIVAGTTCSGADVNDDGRITAADLPALVVLLAAPLPSPTASPTPSATPTAGEAPTASPTPTPTPSLSPTASPSATPTPTPTLPPCPPDGAALRLVLDNPAGVAPVDVAVTGALLLPSCAAPAGGLRVAYDTTASELPPRLDGLAPGLWLHSLRVRRPATGQLQRRQSLLVAGSGDNVLRFTVFAAVATVRTAADVTGAGSLRDALAAAADAPKPFLIRFDDEAFPPGLPTTIVLETALPRLLANDVTIDGLDATGAPANRIVDAGGRDIPVLSIGGARNHLLGLWLRNAGRFNRDVLSINGPGAWGNRIEHCTITEAATGDGIGIDGGAGTDFFERANVVVDSVVSGAADKGVKVTGGSHARIERSIVRDNHNGGLQATLGGHLLAVDNVVEDNTHPLTTARNGIAANGGSGTRTVLLTDGNIVRRNGANGIAVLGTSTALVANDYLAANGTAGIRVYNRDTDAPTAVVQGVTAACNGTHGGAVADTARADFGGPTSAGNNAFTQNGRSGSGANFLNATRAPVLALNNQWEQCGRGTVCDETAIAAYDISDHGVWTAFVPAQAHRSQRAPVITAARPATPQAGGIVRLIGAGFNAVDAHSNDDRCADLDTRNRCVPLRGNCVRVGGVPAAVEAVTPTMLAVRMPFTCSGPVDVTVQIQGGGTSTPFPLCVQPGGRAAETVPDDEP